MKPTAQDAVVLGLGFGDEGKGRVVDYLCAGYGKANADIDPQYEVPSLVVRFSGGHQAAHHVVHSPEKHHVFAHFGSGTLYGIPTHWSRYCPVAPVALMVEHEVLKTKDCHPKLYIDRRCPITTLYEKFWNARANGSKVLADGSCGVGIYATRYREEQGFHILFEDLWYPHVLKQKIHLLKRWGPYAELEVPDITLDHFLDNCSEITRTPGIELVAGLDDCFPDRRNPDGRIIFEGSQGLMLDQNFGFFPHVTPSNTGMQNYLKHQNGATVWLVTRAYATRHGNGPFVPHENAASGLLPNKWEMNTFGGTQGEFRIGILSLDYLCYAVNKDPHLRRSNEQRNLVVTCMDQLNGHWRLIEDGLVRTYPSEEEFLRCIQEATAADNVYVSRSALTTCPLEFVMSRR